jgi:CBS domain-containing protein
MCHTLYRWSDALVANLNADERMRHLYTPVFPLVFEGDFLLRSGLGMNVVEYRRIFMTLKDVMTTDPKTLPPTANVQRAAGMMRDLDVGSIPIVDEIGSLVGIITDRDITTKVVAEGLDTSTKIEKVMTRHPVTAPPDAPIEQAIHVMSVHEIRRLAVMEYGKLVGMVSLADIARSTVGIDDKAESLQGVSGGDFDTDAAEVRAISQY